MTIIKWNDKEYKKPFDADYTRQKADTFKEEIKVRVEYCAKQIGDEAMSYAMALLVLPTLMNNMQQSQDYKDWQQSRIKTLN